MVILLLSPKMQKDNLELKDAIDKLAKGEVEQSFLKLDSLKLIHEITDDTKRNEKVAKDYINTITKTKNWDDTIRKTLVVTPTHKENGEVTKAIRKELKASKIIDKKEFKYDIHIDRNLGEYEKKNINNYQNGDIITFTQNAKGYTKADTIDVKYNEKTNQHYHTKLNYETKKIENKPLPLELSERYSVFKKEEIKLSKGDFIRMTQNGLTQQNERLTKNQRYQISKI